MKALLIILGVIMVIMGISLTCTPLITFLATGQYFAILLLVYGALGIVKAVSSKSYGSEFVFSILSVIVSIAMFAIPGIIAISEAMFIYCMAIWFIIQGFIGVAGSFAAKKAGGKNWGWALALGIIAIIIGIYSACHPVLTAITVGILIGIYFAEAGIKMIINACAT